MTDLVSASSVTVQVVSAPAPPVVQVIAQQFGMLLQGESAYDVAVRNGFQGSEAQWLQSLAQGGAAPGDYFIAFAFGDATPAALITLTAGRIALRVELLVLEPFDGVGAALSVGTGSDPELLMGVQDTDPATRASYETCPGHEAGADTALLLFITPGTGATRGRGLVHIEVTQ